MDSHLFAGYEVPPFYDSLLGKLVVWGPTRDAAIERGRVALAELIVDGRASTVDITGLGLERFAAGELISERHVV
jgi:acetyl-CoA carboxylase biotin carboxylase subunit